MNYSIRQFIASCTIVLLTVAEAAAAPNSPATDRFKIGVILPLTGKSASIGEPIKNAASMAYQQLSPAGRDQTVLVFEDDQMSPSKAVAAFHKLVSTERINGVIVFGSAMGNAIAKTVLELELIDESFEE